MKRPLMTILYGLLLCCALAPAYAQLPAAGENKARLDHYQDSLAAAGRSIAEAPNDLQRTGANAKFIKLLVAALKTPYSFSYGFDSLKTVAITASPDRKFRIFSWSAQADDGTYRFYGAIQLAAADGKLQLYPLIDGTAALQDDNQVTTNQQWYGARYNEIIPLLMPGSKTCYALLGWKGHNRKTTKKVIEILSFDAQGPQFGKPVFEGPAGTPVRNRIVFEYNKLNSMTLRLDPAEQMIVFDHLVPFNPEMTGNFEYYASDSTYDGYRLVGNKLKLIADVSPKNDPSEQDGLYVDPKRKDIPVTRKF